MRPPRPILNLAVAMAAVMLAAATARAHAAPQMQPTCKNFGFVTEWKGTLSLVGTGSGTLSDGGTYSINESITASPDLAMGGAPTWTGTFNETIHIDDMESHPDGTFTHITDDETIPQGPISAMAGGFLPGAGLSVNLSACTFQFAWDSSLHETITSNSGTETGTPSQYGFVGLQQSGSVTFSVGSIQSPLPTNGLVLSGNAAVSYFSALLGDPANWTLTWSLNPVLNLDLIITIPQYNTWRPVGGPDEISWGSLAEGVPDLLPITAQLVFKDTQKPTPFAPDNMVFTLAKVSRQPGVSMNWPPKNQLMNPPQPDLSFKDLSGISDFNPNFTYNADGTEGTYTPPSTAMNPPVTATLLPYDWGAFGTLNVTANIAGLPAIQGHFSGDPSNYILLPKRQPGLYTADVWKNAHGIPLSTADTDDSEEAPVSRAGCTGDGLTLYEEYRGFMENGKHIEGDPHNKDFFIENRIGADGEPGIFMFTALTGLAVHKDIQPNEVLIDHPNGSYGSILINFNHLDKDPTHVTDQHGVIIATSIHRPGTSKFLNGGLTILTVAGVHGAPRITDGVAMQVRELETSPPLYLNPQNTHNNSITATNAFLQYDVGVAHELLHSVGVDHHGEGDLEEQLLRFFPPNIPQNPGDQPSFQLNGQNIHLLSESGVDLAAKFWNNIKLSVAACKIVLASPVVWPAFVVENCRQFMLNFAVNSVSGPWVAVQEGQHSGNDQCVMRYWFASLYPSLAGGAVYYDVKSGTENVGTTLCPSRDGTGVNAPSHQPQSRYGPAALESVPNSIGRGSCQFWICVSDAYPLVSNTLSNQQ
jgi:hypothetical protein